VVIEMENMEAGSDRGYAAGFKDEGRREWVL
jgi:hypothetical protein